MRLLALASTLVVLSLACGAATTTPSTTGPVPEPPGRAVELAPSAGVERSDPSPAAPVARLAAGLNDAGFELLRRQPPEENLVLSPLSVGHALLMARAAADPATGDAIDAALGLPQGRSAHEAWNSLDQGMSGSADRQDEITLAIADRIWPALGHRPAQDWIDLLAAEHGASVEALDLQGDPEGSRRVINGWVAEQTRDLIPELLPEGFIDPSTVLVLTDAIYFEARWQRMFGKYPAEEGVFTRLDGSTRPVSFLHEIEISAAHGAGDGYVGAEIPYVGGEFAMLLIVPDEGRFHEVREALGQELIDELDASFTEGPYELFLPGWDDHAEIDLLPWLEEIGAAPGLYPAISPDAFLGGAVHGADITVDEWGTVAAAATGMAFEESAPAPPEFVVRADRPFLYLIRHHPSGSVLFAGQVVDPTA